MKYLIIISILLVISTTKSLAQECRQEARPAQCAGNANVGSRCPQIPPRTMWYYDADSGTCREMSYLGCRGNANRWCSKAGCERGCVRSCPQGSRPNHCIGNRNVGNRCRQNPPRTMWYYDADSGTCREMPYLGCGGNPNRWCRREGCQSRCVRGGG